MRFEQFKIINFKGIREATIPLSPGGSNIFTLIGLNESGKTTILEALNAFSRSHDDIRALYTAGTAKDDPVSFVPKDRKSNFSGTISIEAIVAFEEDEKDTLIAELEKELSCKTGPIPDKFLIKRGYKFDNSDYTEFSNVIFVELTAKKKGQRKLVSLESESPIWIAFAAKIAQRLPRIVYFPTFLFSQPQRIYLNPTDKESAINRQYREIIESVAHSLARPLDIKKHIVDRVLNEQNIGEKILGLMLLAPDKQEQVNAALNELGSHLSVTIFDSWSKIFGGQFKDREIILGIGIDSEISPPQVYLQFALKHRTATYNISERSLGFRWFFSFLLFTLYRASAKKNSPLLFLLDEPASNLHSRAQMQLVASLPRIVAGRNKIIYSTHSHYMVNPDWLDQAFIISNGAVDYDDISETNLSTDRQYSDIRAEKYRTFVGKNPDKTTYFQPVLDKLDVVPSRIDILKPSVLVEGKADYLIIQYARTVLLKSSSSFAVVPTRGAAGLDELIGLFSGWGIPFVICLDADNAGKKAAAGYQRDWALSSSKVFTLSDVSPDLDGLSIEGLLDQADLKIISDYFGIDTQPQKSQIQLFFSEMLAKKKTVSLSKLYLQRVKKFEKKIKAALA